MDVYVGYRGVDHDRRVHLQHAAGSEEVAGPCQKLSAQLQHPARGRGPPIGLAVLAGGVARLLGHGDCSQASVWPTRTAEPGCSVGSHSAVPGGSSRMTVEPMLNRPSSAPRSRRAGARPVSSGSSAARRGLRGVTSPCQTVAMLPTNSAPTSASAKVRGPSSKAHTTRSLRANSAGTLAAVVALTLNSAPGTYQAA